jgi:hypothetical protein
MTADDFSDSFYYRAIRTKIGEALRRKLLFREPHLSGSWTSCRNLTSQTVMALAGPRSRNARKGSATSKVTVWPTARHAPNAPAVAARQKASPFIGTQSHLIDLYDDASPHVSRRLQPPSVAVRTRAPRVFYDEVSWDSCEALASRQRFFHSLTMSVKLCGPL